MPQKGHFQIVLNQLIEAVILGSAFAEGRNKRAARYYLAGKFFASLSDIRMTLIPDPH